MTDADICARMSLGEPTISLTALAELRAVLDSMLQSQEHTAEHAAAKARHESGSRGHAVSGAKESRWEAPE
jgi:hypothetical protein